MATKERYEPKIHGEFHVNGGGVSFVDATERQVVMIEKILYSSILRT